MEGISGCNESSHVRVVSVWRSVQRKWIVFS